MRRALPFVLLLTASCGAGPLEPRLDEERGTYVVVADADGLRQRLELSDPAPRTGDTLHIVSWVVNTGATVDVASRVCGVDVEGLVLESYGVRCAAYSRQGPLAAGDSLWSAESGIVRSGPGRHTLRVRHLLRPERWVEVEVTVTGP